MSKTSQICHSLLGHCNETDLNHSSTTPKFTPAPLTVAELCRGEAKKVHANNFLILSNIYNHNLVLSKFLLVAFWSNKMVL